MSEETLIQWASSTWNPWIGCDKVSPGCWLCYIVNTTPFRTRELKHGDPRQRLSENYWKQPARWNAAAEAALRGWEAAGKMEAMGMPVKKEIAQYGMTKPERPRIFPSLCDWLDDKVPIEWLADFLEVIYCTPNLDWLLITKRPENWRPRLEAAMSHIAARSRATHTEKCGGAKKNCDCFRQNHVHNQIWHWLHTCNVPPNVWFGFSAENQEWFDKRYEIARSIPAKVKFISAEPLLGPIEFKNRLTGTLPFKPGYEPTPYKIIDWVIVGGESGDRARPCHVQWISNIITQCAAQGVACFVKQLGADPRDGSLCCHGCSHEGPHPLKLIHKKGGDIYDWPEQLRVREFPVIK